MVLTALFVFTVLVGLSVAAPGDDRDSRDSQLPDIPIPLFQSKDDVEVSGFIEIWKNRVYQHDKKTGTLNRLVAASSNVAKTVLTPSPKKMKGLLPEGSSNPLNNPRFKDLTTSFLLDSLTTLTINFDDPKINATSGLVIKTISNKDLVLKMDKRSKKLKVNDIPVRHIHQIGESPSSSTVVMVLDDFLFDYRNKIGEAKSKSSNRKGR